MISFDDSLAAATSLNSAKSIELLDNLLNEIKTLKLGEAKEDQENRLLEIDSKFPRGGILAVLERNPDLLGKGNHSCQKY